MLHCCAIYVSSGSANVIHRVAGAAMAAHPRVAVVDTFTDSAYARSSVKLVAETDALLQAAEAASAEALQLVDLTQELHPAPHPRQGALDMVSFMPLTNASVQSCRTQLTACDTKAWMLGSLIGRHHCPVLMYGPRAGRSLLDTRRRTSFFSSCRPNSQREVTTTLKPDFGVMLSSGESSKETVEIPQRRGIAIVGAQPYVTNFNIQVEGASLTACRAITKSLRTEMGVQVMTLPHESSGTIEIGCNLQATQEVDSPPIDHVQNFVGQRLPTKSRIHKSYVIGLTPEEAKIAAEQLLSKVD